MLWACPSQKPRVALSARTPRSFVAAGYPLQSLTRKAVIRFHGWRFVTLSSLFFVWLSATASNPIWTTIDKRMIKQLGRLDYTNPVEVAEYFSNYRNGSGEKEIENLGFGWKVWHTGVGGGYVGVTAEFYYFQDSIVAFEVIPRMPTEPELQARYKEWYSAGFAFEDGHLQPRAHNMRSLEAPLVEYRGRLDISEQSDSVRAYMSPACGTRYGFRGGYGGGLTSNRACFKNIRTKANDDLLVLMMHSINPATRLTAIEYYYYRSGHVFGADPEIDAWVFQVFDEVPKVYIALTCVGETMDAHQAAMMFAGFADEWYEEK